MIFDICNIDLQNPEMQNWSKHKLFLMHILVLPQYVHHTSYSWTDVTVPLTDACDGACLTGHYYPSGQSQCPGKRAQRAAGHMARPAQRGSRLSLRSGELPCPLHRATRAICSPRRHAVVRSGYSPVN